MSEPVQQPSQGRKVAGCLTGLLGGGLAFLSLLMGICGSAEGELDDNPSCVVVMIVVGAMGIAILIYGSRLWRRS